jgi:flagellar basal-body rod modification protein FlgD
MSTSVSSTSPSSTTSATAASSTAALSMNENDFLNLLVTQLRYQNPLDPTNATDFASQLAQYASVEQLSNINTNLTSSLSAQKTLTSSLNNALATTFIGKDVRAETSAFQYSGTGTVQVGYDLASSATNATVNVYNAAGSLVKSIAGTGDTTENIVKWDGTLSDGTVAPSGSYTFSITATDSSGNAVTATPYVYGTVTAVRYKSSGTVFVIDGTEVSLANVLEIMEE